MYNVHVHNIETNKQKCITNIINEHKFIDERVLKLNTFIYFFGLIMCKIGGEGKEG